MKMNKTTVIWLAAFGLLAGTTTETFATGTRTGSPLLVNPAANSRPGAAAADSVTRSGDNDLTVRIINSCYATNLRGVANPLAPSSNIEAKLSFTYNATASSPGKKLLLTVTYPAALVTKAGIPETPDGAPAAGLYKAEIVDGASTTDVTARVKAGFFGNIVRLDVAADDITLEATGETSGGEKFDTIALNSNSFWQHITSCDGGPVYGSWGYSTTTPAYTCGEYMGVEGELSTGSIEVAVASDNKSVDIAVPFPGQTAFCGGYFSPLMLFMDKARPKFNGRGNFKLSEAGGTFWVEAGAPGHFLAIDRNKNGAIDGKDELFGDQEADHNGFDALKELDSNKDGLISSKDAKWKDLVLWQDKNGDGVSQIEEMQPASKTVVKISLKYSNAVFSYGEMAQARQSADFWFKAGGKTKKGRVEDIWFAPLPAGAK